MWVRAFHDRLQGVIGAIASFDYTPVMKQCKGVAGCYHARMLKARSFTFVGYEIDVTHSTVTCTYRVEFSFGFTKTFRDMLHLPDVAVDSWSAVPEAVLRTTLEALVLMLGINYWAVFPTKNIHIEGFALSREQAMFWDSLYLNGLAEFFYDMQMDFEGLISFPFDENVHVPTPEVFERPARSLLLNGAGKDSVLSAEMLKASGTPFDFFAFAPTPAHKHIGALVRAQTIRAIRRYDPWLTRVRHWFGISSSYPSVSTFTFVALLAAELRGYDTIIFSNERSADFGNLSYKGLPVNHQWCKSTEAEQLVNAYIERYITPSISSRSLLRTFSELEIVRRVVQYPQYLRAITSCNSYFWLPRPVQRVSRTPYWCKRCPKCVFIFTCYAAFLPKEDVLDIFGANLFAEKRLLPLFRRILGVEGFKPLDCVGEPEEMILAMQYASQRGDYADTPAMQMFQEEFPTGYDFERLKPRVFAKT